MANRTYTTGRGADRRQSHQAPRTATDGGKKLHVQTSHFVDPHYPFQPLPTPNGPAPYRYSLARFLTSEDIDAINHAGVMVLHSVGDTGDFRGQKKDFVAGMMTEDATSLPAQRKPAFFYHLGDVIYFAGDIDDYGNNFYETYENYPAFIVAIPGNHDCQPDDPQDGPVDPNKVPMDGWVQNFMAKDPSNLGSQKTGAARTQMDLPNVYWTFNTPLATFIGLFSNVGETQGEFHQDQIDWFKAELAAADPDLALVVTVHHPPYSGDTQHTGSSVVYNMLFSAFAATNRYPHLILSGHVHNYQRFTKTVAQDNASFDVTCAVIGNGGYTKLGRLQKIDGAYPAAPYEVEDGLTLEQYDQEKFGFLRLEITKSKITGHYIAAPYVAGGPKRGRLVTVSRLMCGLTR
jgi:hypothetical protein